MASSSYLFLPMPEQSDTRSSVLLRGWLPVIVMLSLFCVESTASFGADRTSGPLHAFAHAITGSAADSHWSMIHHLIRKTGHFLGYGSFSLAWLRALLLTLRPGRNWAGRGELDALRLDRWLKGGWHIQLAAIAATFAVAGLDELHQSFLPNRTGKFSDVVLDTAGALTLQIALRLGVWAWAWIVLPREICVAPAETAAA